MWFTITRRRVKSVFMRLCNSSVNCSCRLISLLDGFFRFLKHLNQVFIFCRSYFLPTMTPLSLFIGYIIWGFHHFLPTLFLHFFLIFTNGIIDVMLHCYCISFTRRLIVDLKFFASVGIIFPLRFQIIVRTCAFMIW